MAQTILYYPNIMPIKFICFCGTDGCFSWVPNRRKSLFSLPLSAGLPKAPAGSRAAPPPSVPPLRFPCAAPPGFRQMPIPPSHRSGLPCAGYPAAMYGFLRQPARYFLFPWFIPPSCRFMRRHRAVCRFLHRFLQITLKKKQNAYIISKRRYTSDKEAQRDGRRDQAWRYCANQKAPPL